MLSLALATSALFALAHAAAPVAFTASVSVVVDDKQPASRADKTVVVPELIGDGLTISIADYNGVEYKACLKLGVAAPVSAGMANWENALYCELFHFTNVTSAATASFKLPVRARSVPSNLRGVGSEAGAVAADAVVVDSMHVSALARRSVEAASAGQRGVATKNVRAGEYFVTIAPVSPQKSNATLTLNFSGMTCGAGNAGANCAPLPVLTAGTSFTVTGILPNTSAIAQLGNYEQINGTTASVTVAAEVDSPNGDVLIAARWGALPTATLFDASFVVAKANTPTVATLPAPRAARWYFGIFNTNKTAVTANVTVTFAQCGAGKFGPTCNTTVTPATVPGQTIANDNVKTGAQFYYTFHRNTTALFADAVNAAALAFAAAQIADPDANATAPSIYARVGALPTTSDFDYVDCTVQCSDEQNTLIVPASDVATSLESQPWYLLVVANTDGSLVAWNAAGGACAGNCTAHGTCDAANALCTCTDDYAAFDCADKKSALERWEWALIIGGAVLVAIGLIGCIVYFIQRQSRRAGFERV